MDRASDLNTKLTIIGVTKSMQKALLILASLSLLSACGGRNEREVVRQDNKAFQSSASRSCLASLDSTHVRFATLPNQIFGGGCQTIDTIKLLDFGTPASNLGAMTCPLAANFTAWAKNAVIPAARAYFKSEIVKIETMGTYSCRNVNSASSGKLSEHASGNAVDVSGFVLKDGRRITVLSGWNGKEDERAFLRRLRESACKRFGTVLSPDYNAFHANHLHFDMAKSMKDGSVYCR